MSKGTQQSKNDDAKNDMPPGQGGGSNDHQRDGQKARGEGEEQRNGGGNRASSSSSSESSNRGSSSSSSSSGEMTSRGGGGSYSMMPGGSSSYGSDPFSLFDELASEMGRLFDDFGFGGLSRRRRNYGGFRGGMSGSYGQRGGGQLERSSGGGGGGAMMQRRSQWAPQIEAFYNDDDDLVVRADLPGMDKGDIDCKITRDNMLVISGERRSERNQDDERSGRYVSERSYGSFHRSMSLPEHIDSEKVEASFENGVLELTIGTRRREDGEHDDGSTRVDIK